MPLKGKTNNPNGRPLKNRALTEILEAAGQEEIKGSKLTRSQFLAHALWSVVTNGEVTLANKKLLQVSPSDWLGVVQFLYKQIDGPPPQMIELPMDQAANVIRVIVHGAHGGQAQGQG